MTLEDGFVERVHAQGLAGVSEMVEAKRLIQALATRRTNHPGTHGDDANRKLSVLRTAVQTFKQQHAVDLKNMIKEHVGKSAELFEKSQQQLGKASELLSAATEGHQRAFSSMREAQEALVED